MILFLLYKQTEWVRFSYKQFFLKEWVVIKIIHFPEI